MEQKNRFRREPGSIVALNAFVLEGFAATVVMVAFFCLAAYLWYRLGILEALQFALAYLPARFAYNMILESVSQRGHIHNRRATVVLLGCLFLDPIITIAGAASCAIQLVDVLARA